MSLQDATPKVVPLPGLWRRKPCPAWARWLHTRSEHLLFELGAGPRPLRLWQALLLHRLIGIVLIGGLMYGQSNVSVVAWLYLGLYASYATAALLKDLTLPNPAHAGRLTVAGTVLLLVGLSALYGLLSWLIVARHVNPSATLCGAVILLHTLGVALMFCAELQKNTALRQRPGLITDGLYAHTRNPNHLGELMIYASYALLAAHALGYAVLAVQFFVLCLPRMLAKDASISRHPGWLDYQRRSSLLLPWALINGRALRERRLNAPAPPPSS